jgi:arylformamidase
MATAAPTPDWYDSQYNNRARIPGHPAILQGWADDSAAARARLRDGVLDLAYGDDPSERLDVFPARAPAAPVLVFLHGGYWRALDKRDASFVAPPFVEAGAMVVVPNYALCPAVSMAHIVDQMARALAWVYRHAAEHGGDPSRIVVAGHSAGGHLAAMLLAVDWPRIAADLPEGMVGSALAISGLFDLEPLRHAPFLAADIGLTEASARALSPAFLPAPARGRLVALVGGDESEEFHRQNAQLGERWGREVVVASAAVPGRNHMDVLNELAGPGSMVQGWALRLLGLA